jgi:hypothetical protein
MGFRNRLVSLRVCSGPQHDCSRRRTWLRGNIPQLPSGAGIEGTLGAGTGAFRLP